LRTPAFAVAPVAGKASGTDFKLKPACPILLNYHNGNCHTFGKQCHALTGKDLVFAHAKLYCVGTYLLTEYLELARTPTLIPPAYLLRPTVAALLSVTAVNRGSTDQISWV
jgi:hypothetical protein